MSIVGSLQPFLFKFPSAGSAIHLCYRLRIMDQQHSFLFLILAILLLLNSETPVTAALPLSIVNGTHGQLHTYIVQVERLTEGNKTLLTDEQQEDYYRSFLPNNTLDSGEPRLIYSYTELLSGFAARLTPEELTVMKSMDGFVHAHREEIYTLQTTYTYELLELNSYKSSLWKESNYGEGVIVGVIDSGIIPTHPSFTDDGTMPLPPLKWRGRCGFKPSSLCNNKLIGAVSFTGGRSPEPYDDSGHGTHVAGIAVGGTVYDASVLGSASGTAIGMAPRAHLAVYKGCRDNGCPESDTMKCIEQAFRDGVDVINMSFHSRERTLKDSSAQMTFVAMKRENIVSTAIAGNTGPWKSRISHSAPWFITVGAASTERRVTAVVRLGNGMEFEGQSAYQPSPSNLTGMLPIVYPGVKETLETLTCQRGSMQGFDVKGKLVLCGNGGKNSSRPEKGRVVEEAGGAAVVILSQAWEGYTTSSDPHYIPAAHVSFVDSLKILNYLQTEKNPTGTIEFRGTNFGARPSPTVASFSARGPCLINGGILKPDIIAPGVNILSAWNEEVGPNPVGSKKTFNFLSGTSMAAPHVTGITALLRKNHPGWSAAAIKSALMTTATRYDQDGKPFADDADGKLSPASVFAVGAGHVDPPKANDPGLIYDIGPDDYISYLCGILTDFQVSFIALEKVVCSTRARISAEQLNYPSILVSLGKSRTGKITVNRTVTNVGEANSEYTAHVKQPNGVAVSVNPTTLQFSDLDQKENFSIELTLTGAPPSPDDALEGELVWVSSDNKYTVRSPIVVTA